MKVTRLALFILQIFVLSDSLALDQLPYSNRTRTYNAWSASPRGDLRTVGMAGATIGLADSFISSLDNPAGIAMSVFNMQGLFSIDTVYDGYVQNLDNSIRSYNLGVATNIYPWGLSFGYLVRNYESQSYGINPTPGDPVDMAIGSREFRVSFARLFFKDRLSLGASLILGQGSVEIDYPTTPNIASYSFGVSAVFGAMVQMKNRILLGASYSLPTYYPETSVPNPTPGLTNYFQGLRSPARLGLGVGWLPNRFFRGGFSLFVIGRNGDSALLRDNSIEVGQRVTLQPHLGLSYKFVDYQDFKSVLFVGSYFEMSRVQGQIDRLHGTIGLELKPWIMVLGLGLDTASQYKNYQLTLSLDVIRALSKIDAVPGYHEPPLGGLLPSLAAQTDDEMPRALVKNWKPAEVQPNPIDVGLSVPQKIEEKTRELTKSIADVFRSEKKKPQTKKKLSIQKKSLKNKTANTRHKSNLKRKLKSR